MHAFPSVPVSPVSTPKPQRRVSRMDKLFKRAQTNLEAKFRRGNGARGSSTDVTGDGSPTPVPHIPKIRTPMRALPLKGRHADVAERDSSPTPRRLASSHSVSTERLRKSAIPMRASPDLLSQRQADETAVKSLCDDDKTSVSQQLLAPMHAFPLVGDSPSMLTSRGGTSARRLHEEVHPGVRISASGWFRVVLLCSWFVSLTVAIAITQRVRLWCLKDIFLSIELSWKQRYT